MLKTNICGVEFQNPLMLAAGIMGSNASSMNWILKSGAGGVVSKSFSDGAKALTFVIGGSNGLTTELLKKSNKVVSFGKITYPHQLMRVLLLEQIYRAETIINNITYHK
jgi:hypothetical protein